MYSYGQCFDIRLNASRSLNPGAPKMVKPYRLDKAALNMQATQQTLVSMRIGEWQIGQPRLCAKVLAGRNWWKCKWLKVLSDHDWLRRKGVRALSRTFHS